MGQTEKHFKAEETSYYKGQIEKKNDCGDGETSSLAHTQREEEMKKKVARHWTITSEKERETENLNQYRT